jgi:hypothetical protein
MNNVRDSSLEAEGRMEIQQKGGSDKDGLVGSRKEVCVASALLFFFF